VIDASTHLSNGDGIGRIEHFALKFPSNRGRMAGRGVPFGGVQFDKYL
jgi:hypothetical protein